MENPTLKLLFYYPELSFHSHNSIIGVIQSEEFYFSLCQVFGFEAAVAKIELADPPLPNFLPNEKLMACH